MKPNCRGCLEEFEDAIKWQDGHYKKDKILNKMGIGSENYFFATSKNQEAFTKGHFMLWIVNDKGEVIIH